MAGNVGRSQPECLAVIINVARPPLQEVGTAAIAARRYAMIAYPLPPEPSMPGGRMMAY
eukprot:COSAG01_NODE_286_length_19421_cov_123.895663_20_plen_59_part_00